MSFDPFALADDTLDSFEHWIDEHETYRPSNPILAFLAGAGNERDLAARLSLLNRITYYQLGE